jgi:hypothetical protein
LPEEPIDKVSLEQRKNDVRSRRRKALEIAHLSTASEGLCWLVTSIGRRDYTAFGHLTKSPIERSRGSALPGSAFWRWMFFKR